jgi:hypothetical protein
VAVEKRIEIVEGVQRRRSVENKKSDHGIVLDEKAQEQPRHKERAQKVEKTQKDDQLQPLRERSGF